MPVGLGAVAAVQIATRNADGKRTGDSRDPSSGPDRPDNEEETLGGVEATAAQPPEPAGSAPARPLEGGGGSAQKKNPTVVDLFFMYQHPAYEFYQDVHVQIFVAILIGANFLTNVVQMQIDPGNDDNPVFNGFDWFYNIVFAIELLINMYSTWFFRFWMSSWNRFDFAVVSIGLMDQFQVPLPGPLTLLRMMRAFRVFRLFKKVKNLNKIIVALQNAVPGVVNAFVIMMIVMAIYAILAVEFYQFAGDGCHANEEDRTKFLTGRGGCIGEEYFGNFLSSLYTLFQVLTGDSWSEAIARPLMQSPDIHELVTGFFFVSFVLINAIVLINVVVAVLLEKMVSDPEEEGSDDVDSAAPDGAGVGREAAEQGGSKDQAGVVSRQRSTSSAGAQKSRDVSSLLSDVGTLRSDMRTIREEVGTVAGELNKGFDKTQDDISSMKNQLDVILAAVQQVAAARRAL